MKYNNTNNNPLWRKEPLKRRLQEVLNNKDIEKLRVMVQEIAEELNIDILDCAAALVEINQAASPFQQNIEKSKRNRAQVGGDFKMVRYRLEIGHKHQVSVEDLKNFLTDEAGVEKKLIGYIDIHNYYTLIKLPSGMPADIFNHLKSVEINRQALRIKRLGKNNHNAGKNKKPPRGKQAVSRSANQPANQTKGRNSDANSQQESKQNSQRT